MSEAPQSTPAPARQVPALSVRSISKSFGSVKALRDISFELYHGEVMGLLGDNGAGKSTLAKCIAGILRPDHGVIAVNGTEVHISSPHHAREIGIETVHQGLALVQKLDVATNLFLNREILHPNPLLRLIGWLDKKEMRRQSEDILARIGARVPFVTQPVQRLSGGQRQAVAIGRAVGWGRNIVLMDEPAAALGVEQSRQVNELIKRLRDQGVAVLLISHNMQHVIETCDRAVVLRHGGKVGDLRIEHATARDLVDLITGASLLPGERADVNQVQGDRKDVSRPHSPP
ncbi:MAG: ribose transport system ATP-binding protein [Rhodospirillaceae bacterium]|nr:ribose transport system ATP-binding protein [Rhodospirillaceae bacterium]